MVNRTLFLFQVKMDTGTGFILSVIPFVLTEQLICLTRDDNYCNIKLQLILLAFSFCVS